jgi:predicted enzyme related to lactoylglutathione lyase
MMRDPFDALRRGSTPRRPRPEFAAALRRRIEEALPVSTADTPTRHDHPVMVHLGVADADRAMSFFGDLFDWQAERVPWEGHVRHYLVNTVGPQPVITDEPAAPAVRLGFTVDHVGDAARAIESLGGTLTATGIVDDTDGWAMADDGQGNAVVVWKAGRDHPHAPATKPSKAEIEWVEVHAPDVERARRFFTNIVGWEPNDLQASEDASVKLFFTITDLDAAVARVRELGGTASEPYEIGPGVASDCSDDQGTPFSLWQATSDPHA